MPCIVDTSIEDTMWSYAVIRHHDVVEGLLEDLIKSKITKPQAQTKLAQERLRFADEYKSIFIGLYSHEAIEKGMKNIIKGKLPA